MKLLRIHYSYIVNIINVIIISLLIVIAGIVFFINIKTDVNYNNFFFRKELAITYKETIILYFKLIVIIMFSYIAGSSFSMHNNSYHLLIVNYHKNRFKFFITKLLLIYLIFFITCFFIYFIYALMARLVSNWYYFNIDDLKLFFSLFLSTLVYINLAVIFTIIMPFSFSSFIPALLFVFMELIADIGNIDNLIHIMELVLPIMKESYHNYSYYGLLHLGLLNIIYGNLASIIYLFRHY